MPSGNDAKAAAAEFRGQYGISGNAEDLIQANRAAYPSELRAAQLAPVNDEKSKDLDMEDVGKQANLAEGSEVLDAKVRGKYICAVIQTASGHTYKEVLAADGGDLDGDESAEHKVQAAHSEALQKVQEAQAEAEKIIAQAREDAQEEAAKIMQDAQKEVEESAQEAAKAEADESKAAKQSTRGGGSQDSGSQGAKPQGGQGSGQGQGPKGGPPKQGAGS